MTDVTLTVSPSFTHYTVSNGIAGVDRILTEALAWRPKGYFFAKAYKEGYWDGYIRFTEDRRFPSGLLLDALIALRGAGYTYTLENGIDPLRLPELPERLDLYHEDLPDNTLTLRDYQLEAVNSALKNRRGIVNIATNGGKTEVACGIMKVIEPLLAEDERILFLTHSTEIAVQSHKRIEERLQMDVGFIGKGEWDEKRITVAMIPTVAKYIEPPKPAKVRYTKEMKAIQTVVQLATGAVLKEAGDNVQTMATIHSVLESVEDEKKYDPLAVEMAQEAMEAGDSQAVYRHIQEMKRSLRAFEAEKQGTAMDKHQRAIDLLERARCFIADEAHHSSSRTWYDTFMLMENAEFRIGLTGTVDEDADPVDHARFIGATAGKIAVISNDFLIEQGYSARPVIHFETIREPVLDDFDYQTAYDLGIVQNTLRNEIIADQVAGRTGEGRTCLIIVSKIAHGEALEALLHRRGVNSAFIHGTRTTEDRQEALDQLADGKLEALIATTILDEGVDVSGIHCIFMGAGGKSFKKTLQRVGRGLRKKKDGSGLEVYDYMDRTNGYLEKHSDARYSYYANENFEIVENENGKDD